MTSRAVEVTTNHTHGNEETKVTYNGPTEIGHFTFPGRGTTYSFKLEGHDIQLYVTEKRKQVRVWVDHIELRKESR